jgi:REP element-mobilizing transposase RayT
LKRDYIEFQDRSVPLAFLITFRCFGTWLHGDERGSVDRRYYNGVGTPKIKPDSEMVERKRSMLKGPAILLGPAERSVVENAVREVCRVRGYSLHAVNVRTNHAHVVASSSNSPERLMNTFKAYSTRALREARLADMEAKVWSRHGSTRYLWTEDHIALAVDYVVNGQGDELPKFDMR